MARNNGRGDRGRYQDRRRQDTPRRREDEGGHARRIANRADDIDRLIGNQVIPSHSHPGLVFDRYLKIWTSTGSPGIIKESRVLLDRFASAYNKDIKRQQGDYLSTALARQQAAFEAITCGHFQKRDFANYEPLALSLGNDHPIGNGASFDAALGVPVLPGSAIKGLIRATHQALGMGEKDKVERWLGPWPEDKQKKPKRGKLIVLDALPASWPRLAVDIINSHHGDYYIKGKPPRETESPVPVFFLTVANNLDWRFLYGGRELSESELDEIGELLECGLAWLGIGGKTAVGYGRMKPKGQKTPSFACPT